jgi:hypothetical protein
VSTSTLGEGRIDVVVTCSHRKTRPVPLSLQLRSLPEGRTTTRARQWIDRLTGAPVASVPARTLYAGAHWDIARRLPDRVAPPSAVTLWVSSAGYGLIPAEAPIRPYSATFTPTDPDGIQGGPADAAAWWAEVAKWSGPAAAPRSLAQLAAREATTRLLLVLSAPYLAACRADVLAAAEALGDRGQLSIISAGTKTDAHLAEWMLPVDARLEHALGGTRQTVNIRAADHLLATGAHSHTAMRAQLSRLLADQPPPRRYDRTPMTDQQVRSFIRDRLSENSKATHTRLLRDLRAAGWACEQDRFAELFRAEQAARA